MKFNQIQTPDQYLNRVQGNIQAFVTALFNLTAILDGVLIESVSLNTTPTSVLHRLGRPYRGFIVTSLNAGVVIYEANKNTPSESVNLRTSSGTATVSIWVF